MDNEDRQQNRRILIIDDNPSIHTDFRKILCMDRAKESGLAEAESALFGQSPRQAPEPYQVDSAYHGVQGFELIHHARRAGRPYALAFVDVRMPPGWDGVETIGRLWQEDPDLHVVISTAYSDYTWDEIVDRLGRSGQLLILKKPFIAMEVQQLAYTMTEKWNLTRQAKAQLDELAHAVTERTRGLEEAMEKLKQAHVQLLQADKMASIGQLAAGVAHEMNNPIGFISSNLNSLGHYVDDIQRVLESYDGLREACRGASPELSAKAEEVDKIRAEVDLDFLLEDLRKLIAESVEGAQRVRQIVADLRDFSHVDNPDVTEEDINHILDKTINVAWNELKYKTQVVKEYGAIPPIPCYGGRLGQVFLNLLVNAAHAIAEHGTITVRTGLEEDHIWVEIEDTGCGIAPENQHRIFEPFFTTKQVGKGTGLGLHLAYNIVKAHGGQISFRSTVGKGTTFRVELPVTGPPCGEENQSELIARN